MTININPIIFEWQFISIRWYGVLLALGTLLTVLLIVKLFREKKLSTNLAIDLSVWLIIGGLIGARLGHIVFYNLAYYLANPSEIIMINHGGLSSHGLTIGIILTFLIFIKTKKLAWKKLVDLVAIALPILAGFVRLGNFTNSEIVGRTTNLPWGVYFPRFELEPLLRHPSQLYEAIIAFSIFYILYFIYKKYYTKLPPLFITHLFILLYFSTRFLVEFVKEYHTLSSGLTMGQWLSIPFIIYGAEWFWQKYKPTAKKRRNKKRA